jgi:hypothetical protein
MLLSAPVFAEDIKSDPVSSRSFRTASAKAIASAKLSCAQKGLNKYHETNLDCHKDKKVSPDAICVATVSCSN